MITISDMSEFGSDFWSKSYISVGFEVDLKME